MITADVLIIGAGAAGGIAALRLQQAGLKVVALEQGRWHDRADYRGSEWDWELTSGRQWSALPSERQSDDDYPIDLSQSDMQIMNFNGVGGGTLLYNAIWIRLLEENFRSGSLHGFGDDWPLDYAELLPWFEASDQQVGVSGLGGNPAFPGGAEPPLPPLPFGPGAMRVARAMAARGWHWWPDTNAILSTPFGGRHPCVGRGTCMQGCNEGAKSSMDHTHWRPFVSGGGLLETGAKVRRITLDGAGLANGAIWVDKAGVDHFQPANVVLCAANGIGTPRLLLNSACDRYPDGLANSSDLVGRRLMLHPNAAVVGVFDEQFEAWQGPNGSTVQSLEFGMHDRSRGFDGGAKWSLHPMGGGPLMTAMNLIRRGVGGERFHREFGRRLGHGMMWSVMCEDAPELENRVTIATDLVDSAGIPAPAVRYRTSNDSHRNLDWNVARAADIFRDAGAWDIDIYNPAGRNAHLMGTAKMGDDPRTSVVDRWCMSHDIPNLGVIDGSVFVTSGPGNPTSTICALALRASDRLARIAHELPKPEQARKTVIVCRPSSQTGEPIRRAAGFVMDRQMRARLTEWGDKLIPPTDGVPGAGTIVVTGAAIERILRSRPDLAPKLASGLAADVSDFAELALSDSEAAMAIATLLAAGYYEVPEVRRRIGYDGQVPRLQQPDRYPSYFEEGLLDHLLDGDWSERRTSARRL